MDIELPSIPVGILTLLSFFAPYAIAVINNPRWTTAQKRIVSIVVSVALGLVVWVLYYAMTGEGLGDWPQMILLAVAITQTSYSLVTKKSASAVEAKTHRQTPEDRF